MIEEFTKEQEARLEEIRDEWLRVALSTDRLDPGVVVPAAQELYAACGCDPAPVVLAESPLHAQYIIAGYETGINRKHDLQSMTSEEMASALPKGHRVVYNSTAFWGAYDAYWVSFYLACREFGADYTDDELRRLAAMEQYCLACGPVWGFDEVAVVSQRPLECHFGAEDRLHNADGPALSYADGWKIYYMNGVEVPDWLPETPAMELDPKRFAKIDNAEVRREFVRKVGIERIIERVGAKLIDSKDEYELLSFDLGKDIGECHYLKMKNPSIGVYHLEGIDPAAGCTTVQEALNYRASRMKYLNGEDWSPDVLT